MSQSGAGEQAWQQRWEAQERRLRALEDEGGIRDTLYQYCHSLDYGLEDEWLDCFTDDAVWSWTVRDTVLQGALAAQGFGTVPVGTVGVRAELEGDVLATATQGREALSRMVAGHTRAPGRWHKHCVLNSRIRVDGDSASATSYFVRVDASVKTTGAYVRAMGRYVDDLVRCPDGRWRISRRHCEIESHHDEVVLEA